MAPREIESWNQQGAEEMLRSKSPWASGRFQQGRCNKNMQTRDSPCMGSKCVSSFPGDIKQKVDCLWRLLLMNHTQVFPYQVLKSIFMFSTELLTVIFFHLKGGTVWASGYPFTL